MPNSEHDELRTILEQYADEARRSQTARDNMIRTAHMAGFSVVEIIATVQPFSTIQQYLSRSSRSTLSRGPTSV